MTDREKLFLYHGILVGAMGSDEISEPPGWAKPWIAEMVNAYTQLEKEETRREIQIAIVDALRRRQGQKN